MRSLRLFFVGILMGIADLIPGVSGGTVAFICGIYQNLLDAIKSLQFQSFKKIAWPFILPLGSGIALSLICFARPLYYLLLYYPLMVNAFFFGLIGGSSFFCFRKAAFKGLAHYTVLSVSFLTAYIFSTFQTEFSLNIHFLSLFLAGAVAACALLLPGISGSYVLHLLGIYRVILFSLGHPFLENSLWILFSLGIGVAFGLIVFSRIISWLLKYFYQMSLAVLIGFMMGGMRSLWPFFESFTFLPLLFILLGFCVTVVLTWIQNKETHSFSQK